VKNLRRVGLAFIPSSRFIVVCAGSISMAGASDLSFCFGPVPGWSRLGAVDANVAPIGHASDAAIESVALPPKVQALTIRCAEFA
jgi:hypothetical protein